jgi:CubicO group peptidase (beta-lactamase class C family)
VLLLVVAGVYGWAYASTDTSTIARALVWRESDVGDQHRFPARRIAAGPRTRPLLAGVELDLGTAPVRTGGGGEGFDEFLRKNDTLAFLVVHGDRLVRERYFDGTGRGSLLTSFSVAKSFLSTLVGIATDEGLIESIQDPLTTYVPELVERDQRFAQITLRDLLTMSSGLRYWDTDLPWPWADDTYTYYGVDLREVALNKTEIEHPSGEEWHYNNYNPLLLGLVLERATGMSVSKFMTTRLWQPLGAEADATWNLDSESSGFEKLESGINATAADYARFGLLHLHGGEWNGARIVSEEWMRAATRPHTRTDGASLYGFFWWLDSERPGRFYALGDYGQYVYVAPDADAVVVRLGRDWGVDNRTWLVTFREVADRLARRP